MKVGINLTKYVILELNQVSDLLLKQFCLLQLSAPKHVTMAIYRQSSLAETTLKWLSTIKFICLSIDNCKLSFQRILAIYSRIITLGNPDT